MDRRTRDSAHCEFELRVLFVIPGASFGGAHNQVASLSSDLALHGVDSIVVLPREAGNAAGVLRGHGHDVRELRLRRFRAGQRRANLMHLLGFVRQVFRLRRLIVSEGVDVVQIHGVLQLDVALAARLAGVGATWQLLDTRVPKRVAALFSPAVNALAGSVLCTGQGTFDHHFSGQSIKVPVHLYFPPVDESRFDELGSDRVDEVRSKLGVGSDQILVATVANYNPQKGLRTVVDLALLSDRDKDPIRFIVRGGRSATHPQLLSQLQAEGIRLGVKQPVYGEFEEWLTVGSLLRVADVLLVCSEPRSEGFPTVISEAMYCGLPVVTTPVGSVSDAVVNGVTGWVSEGFDAPSVMQALKQCVLLASDPGVDAEITSTYRRLLSRERCVDAYLSAYADAVRLS